MVLRNCRIIPELSGGLDHRLVDITVSGDKIEKINPAAGGTLASDDIDCSGMTILPGLFDLHVHLVGERMTESISNALYLYHRTAAKLGVFLDYGVTTVRDCGSTMDLGCYLRDGVNLGYFEGPRILSSGHIISPEAMRPKSGGGVHTIANGSEEVKLAARRELSIGADFIKIYATQSMTQVNGQDPKCIFDDDEIAAMVRTARSQNTYVAAHAHSTDAINTCIRNGVRSIEHATYMDDESIRLFTTTPGAYAVLTHAVGEPYHDGDGYNDPDDLAFWTQPYQVESKKRCRALEHRAYRSGVRIGLGTDLNPENFVKYPYEFMIRKESCGMENIDILLQATKISAEIAMLGHVTGEIREGYAADIIAVRGNPDEDMSIMYKKPALVIKAGAVVRNFATPRE